MRVNHSENLTLAPPVPGVQHRAASQQITAPPPGRSSTLKQRSADSYVTSKGSENSPAHSVTQPVISEPRAPFSRASTRDRAKAVFGATLDVDKFSDADVNHLLRKLPRKGAIVGVSDESNFSFPAHYSAAQCEVLMVWGAKMAAKLTARQCDALMNWHPTQKRGPRRGLASLSVTP